jgi:hypothetical protein
VNYVPEVEGGKEEAPKEASFSPCTLSLGQEPGSEWSRKVLNNLKKEIKRIIKSDERR